MTLSTENRISGVNRSATIVMRNIHILHGSYWKSCTARQVLDLHWYPQYSNSHFILRDEPIDSFSVQTDNWPAEKLRGWQWRNTVIVILISVSSTSGQIALLGWLGILEFISCNNLGDPYILLLAFKPICLAGNKCWFSYIFLQPPKLLTFS